MLSSKSLEALMQLPTILSIKDMADFCSTTPMTFYRVIHNGLLSAYKDAEGNWNVLREDFIKYLRRRSNL